MSEDNRNASSNSGELTVLGTTYEAGKPLDKGLGQWSHKLGSRAEILSYLYTGQRYFYSNDWFGSEKRKTPA
jgi:hypothetical protein